MNRGENARDQNLNFYDKPFLSIGFFFLVTSIGFSFECYVDEKKSCFDDKHFKYILYF